MEQIDTTAVMPTAKVYTQLHKLPYSVWKDVVCDEDLTLLIISGQASQDELQIIWQDLLEQYSESMGRSDVDERQYYSTYQEYLILKRRQDNRLHFVELLRTLFTEPWAKQLGRLMYMQLKLDPSDMEAYNKTLNRCEQLALKDIAFGVKQAEIAALEEQRQRSNESGTRPDRKFFSRVEANIEDDAGHAISWDRISTLDYCERVVRYIERIERLKNQQRR